jgi:hypothetical protein
MDKQESNENPREIPTHKDPEKVKPVKDPSLKPSNENPRDPKTGNNPIKS